MADDNWVLSVDGGGTKTDLFLLNQKKRRGLVMTGTGTNPNLYGGRGVERLANLIQMIIDRGSCSADSICWSVIGMAGISNPKYKSAIEGNLKNILPEATLILTSDAELAHRSIWGFDSGITLIVGTGSIALGSKSNSELKRAGGFGYQVGDEGSGYWLGKSILTELIVAERSSIPDVIEILDKLLKHHGYSNLEDLINFLSFDEESIPRVANLAPIVLSFAKEKNLLASSIVARGAEALADLVTEIVEKIDAELDNLSIGYNGSVIAQSQYYRNVIEDQLLLNFNRVEWMEPKYPSVFGGLLFVEPPIENFSGLYIQYV